MKTYTILFLLLISVLSVSGQYYQTNNCDEINRRIQELRRERNTNSIRKTQRIANIRNGNVCSKCGRDRQQIEQEERISYDQHLQEVDGVSIPWSQKQEWIQGIEEEYNQIFGYIDDEIAQLKDECHQRDMDAINDEYEPRMNDIDNRIQQHQNSQYTQHNNYNYIQGNIIDDDDVEKMDEYYTNNQLDYDEVHTDEENPEYYDSQSEVDYTVEGFSGSTNYAEQTEEEVQLMEQEPESYNNEDNVYQQNQNQDNDKEVLEALGKVNSFINGSNTQIEEAANDLQVEAVNIEEVESEFDPTYSTSPDVSQQFYQSDYPTKNIKLGVYPQMQATSKQDYIINEPINANDGYNEEKNKVIENYVKNYENIKEEVNKTTDIIENVTGYKPVDETINAIKNISFNKIKEAVGINSLTNSITNKYSSISKAVKSFVPTFNFAESLIDINEVTSNSDFTEEGGFDKAESKYQKAFNKAHPAIGTTFLGITINEK